MKLSALFRLDEKFKTSAKSPFFKDFLVGDEIIISTLIEDKTRRQRIFASYVTLTNVRNNLKYSTSFTVISKMLDRMVYTII